MQPFVVFCKARLQLLKELNQEIKPEESLAEMLGLPQKEKVIKVRKKRAHARV
jgi:hypothetical protein